MAAYYLSRGTDSPTPQWDARAVELLAEAGCDLAAARRLAEDMRRRHTSRTVWRGV